MAFFTKKAEEGQRVLYLPIGSIAPNPHQPRRAFPAAELDELSHSIAKVGILQPLTVRRMGDGSWELVTGERRLRAAALAGLKNVPCLVADVDDEMSSLLALVENVQRQDLDFWEEALAISKLIASCKLSQEEAARQIGKSQSSVANKLRLLRLPVEVLQTLRDAGYTERHARALLRLEDPAHQRQVAELIVQRELTVAQTEACVEGLLSPVAPRKVRPTYVLKDVRLFLNTVNRAVSIMNAAGVKAQCGREETEAEILLTIHIPK
jgi:ParB family chromosome partitioning protein